MDYSIVRAGAFYVVTAGGQGILKFNSRRGAAKIVADLRARDEAARMPARGEDFRYGDPQTLDGAEPLMPAHANWCVSKARILRRVS